LRHESTLLAFLSFGKSLADLSSYLLFAGVLTQVPGEKAPVLADAFDALTKVIRGIDVTNYEEFFIKQHADRIRNSVGREISERLASLQELSQETYQELVEGGVINEENMNEEEIKKLVLDYTMEKVLEKVRNQLRQEDLQWIDESIGFAVQWQFERKLEQYNQWKQDTGNQQVEGS
jgi:hypothetical protein